MDVQQSPVVRRAVEYCEIYARVRRPIVFVGPIGVGKSTLARLVHQLSGRPGPFMAISAGEIPDSLAPSMLFGHLRGAFTGATDRRMGAFESADGGTLLLDDVANISTYVQGVLLRVLEDRTFRPVGAARDVSVTCREMYATTSCLDALVDEGTLMPDFRSRMGELVIEIPPLNARREDILGLAEHHLTQVAEEFAWRGMQLTRTTGDLLLAYGWPYNVRELKGVIERAAFHARHHGRSDILPDDLPDRILEADPDAHRSPRLTRRAVRDALRDTGGNRSKAARQLGVHRNSLYRYLPSRAVRSHRARKGE